ncbi:hypothetical protein ABK040_014810 [Willaertia magna]
MEHFLTTDILSLIGEYLNDVKDYIHLFQINKFVYNNILNNNQTVLRNDIFKNEVLLCLNEKFPLYLFQLQNLNIVQDEINNFNLLDNFNYLKYLEIQNLPENFIFPNLPLLAELIIKKSTLQENTLINLPQQLKILNLHECTLEDNCLNYLNNLQELKLLDCKELSGECLQNFKQLTKLDIRRFYGHNFTNYISDLINLKHLTIQRHEFKYNSNFLQKLINLEYLNVTLEDIYEEDFNKLKKLQTLNISGNILSENCFTNLKNLKELSTSGCNNFTGKCLLNLKNLEKLNILETDVKDEYLINLQNLKEIYLLYCNKITGECLLYLNNLQNLYISYNNNLKDEYFKDLNNLRVLNIYKITDNYLQNLKNLQELCITNCENLTGKCFDYLINLKELSILFNNTLKENRLKQLNNLNYLFILDCPQLIKKGKYLLQMDKLRYFFLNEEMVVVGKNKIKELKERIKKGETLKQILQILD